MIYIQPAIEDAIRQGDIFRGVPRIDLQLSRLPIVRADDTTSEAAWSSLVSSGAQAEVHAIVSLRPVTAIVITQDCDAVRSPDIALCEVGAFRSVEPRAKETKSPTGWTSIITQHARINQKWFYLPPDGALGFTDKMAADFRTVLRVGRSDLDDMRASFRVGRLNDVALEHFRERVGEFFRRFPYDEWYPLNREEFDAYAASKPEPVAPLPWQQP